MAAASTMDLPQDNIRSSSGSGHELVDGFSSLSLMRQLGLMLGLAVAVALGFFVVLWSQEPDYKPLYGSLDRLDSSEVLTVLDQYQIAYKIEPTTGALLVDSDDVHTARLKLAEQGIPGNQSVGFELLDQEQPLGTSQFIENTRYHRGLEGELARTIASINSVRKARVHLAIPKRSVFIRDAKKPTASVLLEIFPGRKIEERQVMAIANLVASSISELKSENVTIVDQHGNLFSTGVEDASLVLADKHLKYTKEMESNLLRRVNNILEPVVGAGNFQAEISATIDFTAVEQAQELYNNETPVVRSEHTINETRTGNNALGGIPGALTNQPPADGAAPEQIDPETGLPVKAEEVKQSRENITRNYELDRTISYTRQQEGNIERLSAAVVINDKTSVDAEGIETRTAWTPEELSQLLVLVQGAVGYSADRGDIVNVIGAPFFVQKKLEFIEEETPLWKQSWVMSYIKPTVGFLMVLVVIFGLLRPVMKSISRVGIQVANDEETKQLEALESAGLSGDLSEDSVTLTGGAMALPGPEDGYEQQLGMIKGLIAEDPARVAQVVKSWVNKEE